MRKFPGSSDLYDEAAECRRRLQGTPLPPFPRRLHAATTILNREWDRRAAAASRACRQHFRRVGHAALSEANLADRSDHVVRALYVDPVGMIQLRHLLALVH